MDEHEKAEEQHEHRDAIEGLRQHLKAWRRTRRRWKKSQMRQNRSMTASTTLKSAASACSFTQWDECTATWGICGIWSTWADILMTMRMATTTNNG